MRMNTRDKLADYAHRAWVGWMVYLFKHGELLPDGRFAINAEKVERWQRQMKTDYRDLPPSEQASDQAEADVILEIIQRKEG